METVLSYLRQYATALGNRLWKPLMETVLSYLRQYATALGNRLWKRYATACLVTYPVMQPLMETVLAVPKPIKPLWCSRLLSCSDYMTVKSR